MGYLSQRGKIGKYKGKDVYVVDLCDIREDMKYDETIFLAIIEPDRQKAIMVWDGFIVGELDDYGEVHLYPNKKGKYIWPEKKKKVEPVKKRKEEVEVKEINLDKLALNVSNGYGQFSKVVDGFFAGLEKLWQEIDVEIQGQGNL